MLTVFCKVVPEDWGSLAFSTATRSFSATGLAIFSSLTSLTWDMKTAQVQEKTAERQYVFQPFYFTPEFQC